MAVAVAAGLALCIAGSWWTRDASPEGAAKAPEATAEAVRLDARLLETARRLAAQADSSEEQGLAAEAVHLADQELDQAFTTALREASAAAAPASKALKPFSDRIAQFKARVAADQATIAQLGKDATGDERLELAKAQLVLDQDELEDARQDLARQGGDKHADLERALREHEDMQHAAAQAPKVQLAAVPATLGGQLRFWLALHGRRQQLRAAGQQTAGNAAGLEREHNALENLVNKSPQAAAPAADAGEEDTAALVARLQRLSDRRKTLTELDQRIQASRQLADVYKRWSSAVATRQQGALHLLLQSLAAVLAILLAAILVDRAIRRAFGRRADRRRLHQLRVIATIAVQFLALVLILFVIFGAPSQTPTIIGLATAGLTVVLKDFIVAFFGWFVLMGRNGIRVGDWVEIEGVGGEVVEIGVLRTVLLEMGNWTGTGHPTGRRVAFVNSFAIEGHYFNFSTAGQWLWDVLQLTLKRDGDPYAAAQEIRETVERETEADAKLAEQDWERATHEYGIRAFSARPSLDLRPAADGMEVTVRYITRAPQRFEVKSRLSQLIVGVLQNRAHTANPAA